jgi:hypothetical protein
MIQFYLIVLIIMMTGFYFYFKNIINDLNARIISLEIKFNHKFVNKE